MSAAGRQVVTGGDWMIGTWLRRLDGRLHFARPRWVSQGVRLKPPAELPGGGPLDFAAARRLIGLILEDNVLPFWLDRVVDSDAGGYRLNHDVRGRWRGPAPKRLVTQARTLWFFARLLQADRRSVAISAAARHGMAFLTNRLGDPVHGGFFWEIDADGRRATIEAKLAYGEAQALFALAAYARASGCTEAIAHAHASFARLEAHFLDREHGGYVEFFGRDWRPAPAGRRGPLGVGPEMKLANTHLHVLEALIAYLPLSLDDRPRRRLVEACALVRSHWLQADQACLFKRLGRDLRPLAHGSGARVSYGHDLEMAHLLIAADDVLGEAVTGVQFCRRLGERAIRQGLDRERGGFFAGGTAGGAADDRRKFGWVQAEALLAALQLFRLTGEAVFRDAFLRTLDWTVRHQIDWRAGEWHAQVEGGRAVGAKAGKWHGPYHNVRALMDGMAILDSLAASTTTA